MHYYNTHIIIDNICLQYSSSCTIIIMISDSIICGNSTGRDRGSDITAVRSILSAGKDFSFVTVM